MNEKALAHAGNVLAAIARDSGVVPLLEVFSASPEELTKFAGDQEMSLEHAPKLPPEKWFLAEDGPNAVNALKKAVITQEMAEGNKFVADLTEFENVLKIASANQVGWRLAIDYWDGF